MMTKRRNLSVLLIAGALAAGLVLEWQGGMEGEAADMAGHETVSPAEAARLMKENRANPDFVVLDVRTPEEYRDGHLEGAVMIDFRSNKFQEELQTLDRGKTYLVYCRTGRRSGSAVPVMEEMGFRKIYHLSDGMKGWKEQGFPTTKNQERGR
jgi:rhodanese-related sulfurtransferase